MKASIALILAASFWGLNFHFAKFMLGESSFIESGTWRYVFGVGTMLVLSSGSVKTWTRQEIPFIGILLVGLFGLFGFNVFFFSGMQYTSALNAALIIGLNPITTVLFSAVIMKTKVTRHHLLGALVSFIGVAFLLTKGQVFQLYYIKLNIGDLLLLAANMLFALHHVWVKKYGNYIPNLQFTVYANLVCLLGFVAASFLSSSNLHISHSLNYWLWSMGIGVFGTAMSFLLWNNGVTKVGADRASIYMNIVPLSTAITSIFLGMEMNEYHIISGLIIITGIVISQLSK